MAKTIKFSMIWRCAGDFLNIPDTRINSRLHQFVRKLGKISMSWLPNFLVKLKRHNQLWRFNTPAVTMIDYSIVRYSFHNSILDRHSGIVDGYSEILDRYNGIVDRYNEILYRYNGIVDCYNGLVRRYNGFVGRYSVILDRHITKYYTVITNTKRV